MKIVDSQDSNWFPNTAATDHITNDAGNLYDLQTYHGFDGLMVKDGTTLPITHTSTASIGSYIKLKEILVVPSITKDLLSISKLTTNFPFIIEF